MHRVDMMIFDSFFVGPTCYMTEYYFFFLYCFVFFITWNDFSCQVIGSIPELAAMNHQVLRCAEESLYYDEVASLFTRLQTECKDFLASLKQQKASLEHLYQSG